MKKIILKRQSGFTVIELIVAVSIIVLLTSLTISRFDLFSDQQEVQKEGHKLAQCIQKAQSYAKDPGGNGVVGGAPRYVEARIERTGNLNDGYHTRCYIFLFKPDTKYADINAITVDEELAVAGPDYAVHLLSPHPYNSPVFESTRINLSGANLNQGAEKCTVTGMVVHGIKVVPFSQDWTMNNNCERSIRPGELGLFESGMSDDFASSISLKNTSIAYLNMKSSTRPTVIRLIFGGLEGGAPIALKCTDGCFDSITPISISLGGGGIPFGEGFSTYIFLDNADNLLNIDTPSIQDIKDYKKSLTSRGMIKVPSYGYPITYENVN